MIPLLNHILDESRPFIEKGKLASYIPELEKADKNKIGICLTDNQGGLYIAGDVDHGFTVQSIIKPIILLLALMDQGENKIREKVGVEATGKPFDAFNYSDRALVSDHINPMINTGAIALCTMLHGSSYEEKFQRLLAFTRKLADNPHMEVDEAVYQSEKATGNKNRALAYMLKAYGLIEDDVEQVLSCYFKACSIQVTCKDLANIGNILANHGTDPRTGEIIFPEEYARYVNAILMICGMYDGSGSFAVDVGVPAKSGVGGGIMAIIPGRMGIGIYSPALDDKGNSVAGIEILKQLSLTLKLSIF